MDRGGDAHETAAGLLAQSVVKSASAAAGKGISSPRGRKSSQRLFCFSGGSPSAAGRHHMADLPPQNSRRVFSAVPIGSDFIAPPLPFNVHARFAGVCLQNRVGSA